MRLMFWLSYKTWECTFILSLYLFRILYFNYLRHTRRNKNWVTYHCLIPYLLRYLNFLLFCFVFPDFIAFSCVFVIQCPALAFIAKGIESIYYYLFQKQELSLKIILECFCFQFFYVLFCQFNHKIKRGEMQKLSFILLLVVASDFFLCVFVCFLSLLLLLFDF